MAEQRQPGEADEVSSGDDHDEVDDQKSAAGRPNLLARRGGELARVVGRRTVALGAGLLLVLRTVALPAAGRWLLPRWLRLSLTIGAGLLLCASFPPFNWWWAAVAAFALLAWVLTRPVTTATGGLGYGLLFGLAFYLPLLPWISTLVGAMPWFALAAMSACFPAVFGLLAVAVRRVPGWPIWFAVLWAVQEWAKSTVPFGGFPWGVVGFGQADGPLLPLVQLGGVPLLSAAIVLLGCCLTAIALEIAVWLRLGHPQGGRDAADAAAAGAPPAVVLPGICICFVLFAAVAVWPQVRHSGKGSGNDPVITVAAVQGNVPRLGLDFNAQRRAVLDLHVRETLQLADDIQAGTAPKPQFVIWPEDSSDVDPLINPDAAEQIKTAAGAVGVPILVGTILDVPVADRSAHKPPKEVKPDIPDYTNTVIVWDPVTGPGERHNKQIVQPFGEYLPWPWLFRHLSGFAERAGHMVPGQSTGVVHAAGVPVGIATCWEVIFDRALRESVLHGAQLLAVPSNNATFNKTMSEQQLAFAKARAVEHDRYVVVAGTTGISAVIAPDGVELARTDFFVPAYLDTQLRLKTTVTPATRWGPAVQWVFLGLAVAVLSIAIGHNGWFSRRFAGGFSSPNRRRKRSVANSATPEDGPSNLPDARDDAEPPADEHRRHAARSRVPNADTDTANEGAT